MGFAKDPIELQRKEKFTLQEVLLALRDDMQAELDAVNLYLEQASLVLQDDVRKTLEEVAEEEKVHFGEFLTLLKKYDKEAGPAIQNGEKEVAEKERSQKTYISPRNSSRVHQTFGQDGRKGV
ncbi:MAG: ferritin family protein [Thermoprotei archaeon]|nr:ferritin family protein [TACK group archaeon]